MCGGALWVGKHASFLRVIRSRSLAAEYDASTARVTLLGKHAHHDADSALCRRHTLKNLVQETCVKDLTQVHHSFLKQQQLSGQSHCTVRVMCWTVSVLEYSCAQLRARNLYQIDRQTSEFVVQDDLHKFLERVSPALYLSLNRH